MTAAILDSLNDINYTGEIKDEKKLEEVLNTDLKSEQFLPYGKLIAWLTQELDGFYSVGEYVQNVNSLDDIQNFLLELGGFLRDYGCPYAHLVQSSNNQQRLTDRTSRIQLLDFLCTELQAAKMLKCVKPDQIGSKTDSSTSKKHYESDEARDLKALLIALGFPRPPEGITAAQICSKVYEKVSELLKNLPPNYLGRALLRATLSEKQWNQIHKINQLLCEDYKIRREMLLKRLDVTIQSFKWADRLKDKNDQISTIFTNKRKELTAEPNVKIEDILAAREDLCHMEKTCGTKEIATTRSKLHKILIPRVPDRGGRTTDLQAPPPDMPSWQRGGSAGGGGRGGHRQEQRQNFNGNRGGGGGGGGWSARGGHGDRPHSGGHQQPPPQYYQQQYGNMDPYAQQYQQMAFQGGQQQVINEYAGTDYGGSHGRGRGGGRGGRGGRRPH